MTLILLAISGTITLCIIAWHLAIYALPVMVGLSVFQWIHATGAGIVLAGLGAIAAALLSVGFVMAVIGLSRNPWLRIAALGLFAVPAAIAGYALIHGVTKDALDPGLGLTLLSGLGGLVVGIAAMANLNSVGSAAPAR
jgi:hypothetical protein